MTKEEKNKLLSDWLDNNSLGSCSPFGAKITDKACLALRERNEQRLEFLDYPSDDFDFKANLEFCVNGCAGLK